MKLRDIVFWLVMFSIVLLCIFLYFYLTGESNKCLSSPLTYGVSRIKATTGEFTCTCSAPNIQPIIVTKDGISQGLLSLKDYNTSN